MTTALIILGWGVLILAASFVWGFFELRWMARDEESMTELTEEQDDRLLDEIARELEQ